MASLDDTRALKFRNPDVKSVFLTEEMSSSNNKSWHLASTDCASRVLSHPSAGTHVLSEAALRVGSLNSLLNRSKLRTTDVSKTGSDLQGSYRGERESKSRPWALESNLKINRSSECGPAYDLIVGSWLWDKNRNCEWALGNFIAACSLPGIQECSQQRSLSEQNTEPFRTVEPTHWRTHGPNRSDSDGKRIDPLLKIYKTSFSSGKVY